MEKSQHSISEYISKPANRLLKSRTPFHLERSQRNTIERDKLIRACDKVDRLRASNQTGPCVRTSNRHCVLLLLRIVKNFLY